MKQKFYTFLLLVMATLCLGANNVMATNYLPGSWNEWKETDDWQFNQGKITHYLVAGTYEFKVKDVMSNVNWYGVNSTMTRETANGIEWRFADNNNAKIVADHSGTYTFDIAWKEESAGTWLPYLTVTYPQSLTYGENTIGNLNAGVEKVCSFVPTKTGYYSFIANNDDIRVAIVEGGQTTIFDDFSYGECGAQLTAGKNYSVSVLLLPEEETDGDITVLQEEETASDVTVTVALELSFDSNELFPIAADENGYYTIYPTETTNYLFDFNPGIITSNNVFYVNVYDVFPSSSSVMPLNNGNDTKFVLELEGSKTYYVEVENPMEEALTTATLTVSKYAPNYTALNVAENTVNLAAAGFTTFKFAAPESKNYMFSLPTGLNIGDRGGIMIYSEDPLIDPDSYVTGAANNAVANCTAEATYYVMVANASENAHEDVTLTVAEYVANYTALALGNNEVTVAGGSTATYTFTPTAAGDYMIWVDAEWTDLREGNMFIYNADPKLIIYAGIRDATLANGVSSLFVTLEANQTYYVGIGNGTSTAVTTIIVSKAYQRKMTNAWGTLCLPYAIDYNADNEDFNLYKLSSVVVSGDEGSLTFTECTTGTITAGTPLAIKAQNEADWNNIFTVNVCYSGEAVNAAVPYTVGDYQFNGTFSELEEQTDIYFIAEGKFWYAEKEITIPANRAWIKQVSGVDQGEGGLAPFRSFNIEEAGNETDNIHLIENADGTVTMSFDLQGRRAESQKGLQIRNGRVVLVK